MTDRISIPERHQEFCRALARVAREHGVNKFSGSFVPEWKDDWSGDINFSWEQGRHGEDSDKLFIASTLRVFTKLGEKP